jgi:sarcosine oxidase subunit beta
VVESDRVTAVETDRGNIPCNFVVNAAGPQIGVLTEMVGGFIPVSPGRVEIIVTVPVEPFMPKLVMGNGIYGRQTMRGNLAYGGGNPEWVDVDNTTPEKPNTPMIRHLGRRLAELFSGAEDVKVLRSWSCVVEQSPDGDPIIDLLDSPVNYVVATGSGDGFGLGPAHGMAIKDLVLHGESTLPLEGYRLSRFSDVPRNWRERSGWAPPPERE